MNFKLSFIIFLSFIFFISCKQEVKKADKPTYTPREIKNITLQKFDHTKFGLKNLSSIRAIDLVDKTAFSLENKVKFMLFIQMEIF